MTNLLYLFNPDQDLALASGEVNYMPPASARRMAEELALLPVWFADGPCSVLAPSAYNQSFLEEMLDLFPLPASLRTQAEDFSEVRSVGSLGMESGTPETSAFIGSTRCCATFDGGYRTVARSVPSFASRTVVVRSASG